MQPNIPTNPNPISFRDFVTNEWAKKLIDTASDMLATSNNVQLMDKNHIIPGTYFHVSVSNNQELGETTFFMLIYVYDETGKETVPYSDKSAIHFSCDTEELKNADYEFIETLNKEFTPWLQEWVLGPIKLIATATLDYQNIIANCVDGCCVLDEVRSDDDNNIYQLTYDESDEYPYQILFATMTPEGESETSAISATKTLEAITPIWLTYYIYDFSQQ